MTNRASMEEAFTGARRAFCGQSQCQDGGGSDCIWGFQKIIQPFSCTNHALIISIDILLLLMLFLTVKSSKAARIPARFQGHSTLQIFSAVFNGILGLVYLVLGCWILSKNYRETNNITPLRQWLVALSIVACLMTQKGSRFLLSLWSVATCMFAAFLCGNAFLVIATEREVSVKIILDVLCFPGAVLQANCALMHFRCADSFQVNDEYLYAPLKGEVSGVDNDSNDSVTSFARAGFLSSLSFWWLNPLMKKGSKKTLEEVDVPQLRDADRAESCFMLFSEQLNKQKQDNHTNSSLWWTLALGHWGEILVYGFFALIKVLADKHNTTTIHL